MSLKTTSIVLLVLLITVTAGFAQTATPPVAPPATPAATTPPADPPPTPPAFAPVIGSSATAGGGYDRRDSLPSVNVYLPDGQASVRLRKLIKNVLFESQIDYKFVTGDISTFLRYKYYARNYSYKVAVFDSIGFPSAEKGSLDFERVRGGLVLFEVPRDYNDRYFLLLQDDRLTFGDSKNADNRKNNTYAKIAYQYGSPFDERMNSIVGESRGRITPVLTAFREIGPQKTGLALALTQSARISTGDYQYTKVEAEGLRRFDLTPTSFVVSRLHFGSMLSKNLINPLATEMTSRYSVPLNEYFRLGGRDALKGVKDTSSRGSDEIHLTNEYFAPLFRNRDIRTWGLHWNTLYGIGYLGAGNVGFDSKTFVKPRNYVVDAGLGSEAALTIRDFEVLLSVVVARTVKAPDELRGTKVRFSIHTIR